MIFQQILNTVENVLVATYRVLKPVQKPVQGYVERTVNLMLFASHVESPIAHTPLRVLAAPFRFPFYLPVFGGLAFTEFNDVRELMLLDLEKLDWFSGPIDDRADYLTKGYVPFLLAGSNLQRRREVITRGVIKAYQNLKDLETLLDAEKGLTKEHADRAIVRFMFKSFFGVDLETEEVDRLLEYREQAAPMVFLPKLLRTTVLRGVHKKLQESRLYFLKRIEATGMPFADSWFDTVWWFNRALGFYSEQALYELRRNPALQPPIRSEINQDPFSRPSTRALVHEMLRIRNQDPSTNYVQWRAVRVALIASAAVDPARYVEPYKVDLTRNHDDTVVFAGPSPTRHCPAQKFAPDLMATIVAHRVRNGWLESGACRP